MQDLLTPLTDRQSESVRGGESVLAEAYACYQSILAVSLFPEDTPPSTYLRILMGCLVDAALS